VAITPIGPGVPVQLPTVTGPTGAGSSNRFDDVVAKALDSVQGVQDKADALGVKAATGDLTDVHDYMIAATQAQLTTELTVAVRNKAVEAFNDIMRMPV
jgi:flagellar hook-basal body complex protein FliE